MRIFKRIAIVITALVIIFTAFFGYYGIRSLSETRVMEPADTGEIIDGIYSLKDNSQNMYVIEGTDGTDGYIAVDSAMNPSIIKRELGKLQIPADKVKAILLTHTDGDHTGSIGLFENANVYISDAEEQMINGKTIRTMFVLKNKLDHQYDLLKDEQTIELAGLKVRCVLTPGHTPGSMAYIVNDKYLFTGDTFRLEDGKAAIFNEFFNMDSKEELKSIEKLSGLQGIEGIFTGHYGYSDDFVTAFKDIDK